MPGNASDLSESLKDLQLITIIFFPLVRRLFILQNAYFLQKKKKNKLINHVELSVSLTQKQNLNDLINGKICFSKIEFLQTIE